MVASTWSSSDAEVKTQQNKRSISELFTKVFKDIHRKKLKILHEVIQSAAAPICILAFDGSLKIFQCITRFRSAFQRIFFPNLMIYTVVQKVTNCTLSCVTPISYDEPPAFINFTFMSALVIWSIARATSCGLKSTRIRNRVTIISRESSSRTLAR